MSLLFSQVTLTADGFEDNLLVSGIPRNIIDLEGWTKYDKFIKSLDMKTEINVHVKSYLYGDGERVNATPEEVAFMVRRMIFDDDFLDKHCETIEDSDFVIRYSPNELFGIDFIEL
ncbi:MAG TPA: hypothetical protein PLT66_07510 [Bacillota bacterium]|nr:hypothetical protein [Bacillota bacterium]